MQEVSVSNYFSLKEPITYLMSSSTNQNVQGSYYDSSMYYQSPWTTYSTCGTCNGSGSVSSTATCSTCSGSGSTQCSGPSTVTRTTGGSCGICNTANSVTLNYTSCSYCGASGYDTYCSNCHYRSNTLTHGTRTCPTCNGNGSVGSTTTCSACSGSGQIGTYHPGYWYGGWAYTNLGTITITGITNDDGSVTLTAVTPSNVTVNSYSWSGNGVSGNTNSITVNSAGTYSVIISLQSGSYTGSGTVSATVVANN